MAIYQNIMLSFSTEVCLYLARNPILPELLPATLRFTIKVNNLISCLTNQITSRICILCLKHSSLADKPWSAACPLIIELNC